MTDKIRPTDIDVSVAVCRPDNTPITVEDLDREYTKWVHTGRNLTITQCDSKYVQEKINDRGVYPISRHIRGKVVLICNAGYQSLKLFRDLFIQMKYKVGIFTEKTSEFMHQTVREEASREENKLVDSFVVVIYGIPDGFDLQQIVEALRPPNARHLQNKPKLVYLIGPNTVARQIHALPSKNANPDLLIGATGFHGLMLVIYVFCAYVHELSAKDIWRLILQYATYHDFPATTYCTLQKTCYFFPGVSQSALPEELANLDPRDLLAYRSLLEHGSVKTYNIRLMFVGLFGVGKTSTARRMMGQGITGVTSTDGIDVYIGKCRVDLATNQWQTLEGKEDVFNCKPLSRLAYKLKNPNSDSDTMDSTSSTTKRPRLERQGRQTSTESDLSDLSFSKLGLQSSTGTSSFEKVESFDEADMTAERQENLDIEAMYSAQKVLKEARETTDGRGEEAVVSLWDFAGQFIYYATHQLFFSPRCIYLLVLNLEIQPENAVGEWFTDVLGETTIEAQGGVNFWLGSIYTYAKGRQPGVPPIILVGTHKDKIPGSEYDKERFAAKYFQKIKDIFYESPIATLIHDEHILLDNSIEDASIEHLKSVIIDVSKRMYYWGEEVPAKWIELEQALEDRRVDGTNFISFKELQAIDRKLASPLRTEDHLKLFLRVHHETGTVIYFEDSPVLRDIVIIQPQWIINAFRHLIRSDDFDWKYGELQSQWHKFKATGRLDTSLAQEIWRQDNTNHFYENYDKLLEVLEKLDIIVKARKLNEDGKSTSSLGFYHVPSLLVDKPPNAIFDMKTIENAVSTPVLCFEFRLQFVPPAVFNRVIALCMGRWPVARQGKHLLLYCGWAVFEVKQSREEDRHRLHVFFKKAKVGLKLVRYSTKNKDEVDPVVCERVRRFVSNAIRREFKRFDHQITSFVDTYTAELETMETDAIEATEREFIDTFPFKFKVQCFKTAEENLLEEGLHDVLDLQEVLNEHSRLETTDTCTVHREGLHQIEPVGLLRDWFPEQIPEHLRSLLKTKPSIEVWLDNLPEKTRNKLVAEEHFPKLSKAIGKNWQFLMYELGLRRANIEQEMENASLDVNKQKFRLFQLWKLKLEKESFKRPSVSTLLLALRNCKNVNIDWDTIKTLVEDM